MNKSYRLLIVAENSPQITELTELLSANGFSIKRLPRFSDAIDTLFEFLPDIVILNSSGNELSALEFCISIKSLSKTKNSIVIMLSDRNDELFEISAFNSGADDCIAVPFKVKSLAERIKVRMKKPSKAITITHDGNDHTPLKIDRESYSVSMGN